MIIRGHNVRYTENSRSVFSRAVIVKEVERVGWFGRVTKLLKPIWTGRDVRYLDDVKRMHPDEMTKWFTKTVDEYEAHQKAWAEHNSKGTT